MIRGIIERRQKKGADIAPLLRELRTAAVSQPGYVSGETLVSTGDSSLIMVISTWQSLEDWQAWEKSETRAKIYQRIRPLLTLEPKVRTFEIAATETRAR